MLVIEGVVPFLFPAMWRTAFSRLAMMADGQVRFMGLSVMLLGVLLLYWIN